MDWKKILSGITEHFLKHFLTKVLGTVFLIAATGFGTIHYAKAQSPEAETRKLAERVAKIMYYLEEILPPEAKNRAEQKMAADKEKLGIE